MRPGDAAADRGRRGPHLRQHRATARAPGTASCTAPEVGTYSREAELRDAPGQWAVGIQFRRDSLHAARERPTWMQDVLAASGAAIAPRDACATSIAATSHARRRARRRPTASSPSSASRTHGHRAPRTRTFTGPLGALKLTVKAEGGHYTFVEVEHRPDGREPARPQREEVLRRSCTAPTTRRTRSKRRTDGATHAQGGGRERATSARSPASPTADRRPRSLARPAARALLLDAAHPLARGAARRLYRQTKVVGGLFRSLGQEADAVGSALRARAARHHVAAHPQPGLDAREGRRRRSRSSSSTWRRATRPRAAAS